MRKCWEREKTKEKKMRSVSVDVCIGFGNPPIELLKLPALQLPALQLPMEYAAQVTNQSNIAK